MLVEDLWDGNWRHLAWVRRAEMGTMGTAGGDPTFFPDYAASALSFHRRLISGVS